MHFKSGRPVAVPLSALVDEFVETERLGNDHFGLQNRFAGGLAARRAILERRRCGGRHGRFVVRSRLGRIVLALRDLEMCVCDIAAALGAAAPSGARIVAGPDEDNLVINGEIEIVDGAISEVGFR